MPIRDLRNRQKSTTKIRKGISLILEMFDNLMKFKVSKTILTNYTNFDKFVQFIKVYIEGSFGKNLRKFQKNFTYWFIYTLTF